MALLGTLSYGMVSWGLFGQLWIRWVMVVYGEVSSVSVRFVMAGTFGRDKVG